MLVRSVSHFNWQALRMLKRSRKPLDGKTLRHIPTKPTKDGRFLAKLVNDGLLKRVTGTEADPFAATYALTERGEHAAEYGEYEYEFRRPGTPSTPPTPVETPTAPKASRKGK
ncbi:MAG: hypothetical protein FJ304_24380 [Planctomycetes bacterium]|nr:hypothetical protein [Planctomycetota bacterium]